MAPGAGVPMGVVGPLITESPLVNSGGGPHSTAYMYHREGIGKVYMHDNEMDSPSLKEYYSSYIYYGKIITN